MASPQGYKKALRLTKQAEKFERPIALFVDTIGAACDARAEENGQGLATANLLQEMSTIKVPVLSIIIGEGGSGGALALAVGNEVWMLENSIYSILTPGGYASIVWKDSTKAKDAAVVMNLGADNLYKMKIVDRIIKEDEAVTRDNISAVCSELRDHMNRFFSRFD